MNFHALTERPMNVAMIFSRQSIIQFSTWSYRISYYIASSRYFWSTKATVVLLIFCPSLEVSLKESQMTMRVISKCTAENCFMCFWSLYYHWWTSELFLAMTFSMMIIFMGNLQQILTKLKILKIFLRVIWSYYYSWIH